MNLLLRKNAYLAVLFFLITPIYAYATPAITCHCFKDRSFDPAHPAMADPYFLATTQNSFFAIVFNTDKMSIVMKKQQGTSPDDLWIAYWLGFVSGRPAESLLKTKSKGDSWKDIVATLRLNPAIAGSKFISSLNLNAPAVKLSEAVVDEIFMKYRLMNSAELTALRQSGASSQELIISTVIAARLKLPALSIFSEVKKGGKTWGSFLQSARIDTKNMQQEISSILKLQPL
ncbi:MAG: hypothetical protein HXX17_03630 [Geobacteraceae bacterium]|nr:hypothetical protein [Geobacteraceae bacterium]